MNTRVLIDSIVRQTTVLIAQLATNAGGRTPLSHVANQVFLELTQELEGQGIRQKVIADMFGLALRSYQKKVRRISESATDEGRSLWEAVFSFIRKGEMVSRADVLNRFRYDDDAMVRGILRDLVDTGLVFKSGSGSRASYRAATDEERDRMSGNLDPEATSLLVWVTIYEAGRITDTDLRQRLRLSDDAHESATKGLHDEGKITPIELDGDSGWLCQDFALPLGSSVGWEAAVFDHYAALVRTLTVKLNRSQPDSIPSNAIGGSTYTFDVWEGHPHRDRVLRLLDRMRQTVADVRADVLEFNEHHGRPEEFERVTFYFGQSALEYHLGEEDL